MNNITIFISMKSLIFILLSLLFLNINAQSTDNDSDEVMFNGKIITRGELNNWLKDPIHDRLLEERSIEVHAKENYTLSFEYYTFENGMLFDSIATKIVVKTIKNVRKISYYISTTPYMNTSVIWEDINGNRFDDHYIITAPEWDYEKDTGHRLKIWHDKK